MKIKKPKHGPFYYYCYECKHWEFENLSGAAILGTCNAILGSPVEQDAYSKPCALYRYRYKNND